MQNNQQPPPQYQSTDQPNISLTSENINSLIDVGVKSQIISFLKEFKTQSFFNIVDNVLNILINKINNAIDAIIRIIEKTIATDLPGKDQIFKDLLNYLQPLLNEYYNKLPDDLKLKPLLKKYINLLGALNFDQIISQNNALLIFNFYQSTDQPNTSLTSENINSLIDLGVKLQIISFFKEIKNQSFLNKINNAIDAIIRVIENTNASNLSEKAQILKSLLNHLQKLLDEYYNTLPDDLELKQLLKKYINLLGALNFDQIISQNNALLILDFYKNNNNSNNQSNMLNQNKTFPNQQLQNIPNQQLQNIPNQQLQNIPNQQLQNIPNQQLQNIPNQQLQNIPNQQLQNIPNQQLQNIPNQLAQQTNYNTNNQNNTNNQEIGVYYPETSQSNNQSNLSSTIRSLVGSVANNFVDGAKQQLISFLKEFENESFFGNKFADNAIRPTIIKAIDVFIREIENTNASNLSEKAQIFKNLLQKLQNLLNQYYNTLPEDLKPLLKKYADLLEALDLNKIISPHNASLLLNFYKKNSNNNNNQRNLLDEIPLFTGIRDTVNQGIDSITGTNNLRTNTPRLPSSGPPPPDFKFNYPPPQGKALADSVKSIVPGQIDPSALSGMIPKGIMPEGLGESGPLSSIYEMIIKKKIEDTFQKIQENICATFNDYKDKIGEAMLQKIIDKIETHSEDFKKFSDVMNDEESKEVDNENKNQEGDENNNKGPIDKDKIEDNIFYKIYNNINAVIETKHEKNGTGETKKDFSDSIIEKYEAWKKLKGIKTIVKKEPDVNSINGGGDGGLMDAFNMAKAAFNEMPLPEAVNKNIREELAKGFKITDDATIKEKEGNNGDDTVNEEENKTYMDIAVNKSIANLKFDFGIPQLDLICEKVFFGLHNPTILIIKLLTTMNIEDRNKLILDMIKINEGIDNDENKQAEFKKKYGIIEWPKQGGFPDKEWPKNKTPWMDDIYCRIFPHTKCHGEKDPEKKKKKTDKNDEKENDKKPDKNDEKKDKTDKNNEKEDVKKIDNFILDYVDSFSVPPPKENEKKGGYENYIQKPRKTRRKRLIKKGNRKNKTYHRRGSLVKAV